MPRSVRDADGYERPVRSPRIRRGTAATPSPPTQLSPAKKRIAEALAALLVAHYRREQKQGERERVPVA